MELFRSPSFRARFNMYPLEAPTKPGSTPPSPYKGTINVRTPLTQVELNRTYAQPSGSQTPEFKAGQQELRDAKTPGPLKKIVGGAVKDVTGTFKSARESASEVVNMGREKLGERRKKADRDAVVNYEKKKQEELKKERWELENQKRAERAERKLNKRSR
jgi:YidC/Oxa1 family membrane protein insertase